MRLLITLLLILTAGAAGVFTLFVRDRAATGLLQMAAFVLLFLFVLVRVLGLFKPRRASRIPPSQVAEMEKLYFRCMRDLLNETPDVNKVINDLQRILTIDRHYKNARHYLNRALLLQAQRGHLNGTRPSGSPPSRAEFNRLQERLIDPDPAVRKAVVMELIQYGSEAIDPVIALLMDEDSDVRVHAATALGWIGGQDAVQPLLVALKDADALVRRYATRALCWVVDESALEGLIEALRDSDSYVRQYAARALGWSQDRRAIRPLIEHLVNEQNTDVQNYAYIALEDLGEKNVRIGRAAEVES
jgi:hypothetical protein